MGYYIEVPRNHDKAFQIMEIYGAKEVTRMVSRAREAFEDGKGVIVVVDNGPFEAAGFAHSEREFAAFTRAEDSRPKTFVIMERKKAEHLSGFKAHEEIAEQLKEVL